MADGNSRLWKKLEELDRNVTRILVVLESRDKECERHEISIINLKERVRGLEHSQAKILGGATLLSILIGYILKGLGVAG